MNIELKDISKTFWQNGIERTVLKNSSLKLQRGKSLHLLVFQGQEKVRSFQLQQEFKSRLQEAFSGTEQILQNFLMMKFQNSETKISVLFRRNTA